MIFDLHFAMPVGELGEGWRRLVIRTCIRCLQKNCKFIFVKKELFSKINILTSEFGAYTPSMFGAIAAFQPNTPESASRCN